MSQIFTIQDDKVVIKKLSVDMIEGPVAHMGTLDLSGPVTINSTLTVDTIYVKHLETESGVDTKFGQWETSTELDLTTKGLSWTWNHGNVQLGYRPGNKLWTNGDIDIDAGKSYMIDGVEVLSQHELSPQITKSKLREIGSLNSLTVNGNATLGEFAFFNSTYNRLGINTESPNGTLSIVDNDVEVVINSPRSGIAQIGTHTNSDLILVSDNTSRITLKSGGEIIFGNPATNNADVKIYGTLQVETIVSDNRIDRHQPLDFRATRDTSIYGLGLIWSGTGGNRQLIMMSNPDRLYTSESFDIGEDKSYHIGTVPVLSAYGIGSTVTQSNLTKLGTLEYLTVEGEAKFLSHINASRAVINAKSIVFNEGFDFKLSTGKIDSDNNISITVKNDEALYADINEISIGNKENTRRPVKVFGQLNVGINTPEEGVDLAVQGNVKFSGKKFINGTGIPTSGNFNKGDICWNQNPLPDNYIGWVCVMPGTPGTWAPFGLISKI